MAIGISNHTFVGRLTKDPEIKEVTVKGEQQKVANFTVAVDDFGNNTDFYDVVAWRGLAVNVEKFLHKGRQVCITGRPKKRSYVATKDGVEFNQNAFEIRAEQIQFLGDAKSNTSTSQDQTSQQEVSDEDIPF